MNDYQVASTSSRRAVDDGISDRTSSPVLGRSATTKKRKLPAVDDSDDGSPATLDNRKRRRRDDNTAAVTAKQEFDVCAAQLLDILHHNFVRCLLQRHESSASARLTPIVGTLDKFVASVRCLGWRTFWHDVYGIMCKMMHFFDAPLNQMLTRNDTIDRLFCPTHLATIARKINEHHNVSSPTLSPACYADMNNDYKNFYPLADRHTRNEENVRVYEQMWPQMTEISTAFINVVWDAIERHIRDPSIEYAQLCDYLKMMYETAMLGGHVLLAVPLSQFAPLRVVQLMNKMRLNELIQTVTRNNGGYGLVYNRVVSITLIAAMHFAVLLRGLRPAQLWPFCNSRWPEFIRNNTAITSYHFLSGVTGEQLLLVGGGAGGNYGGVDRRNEDYVAEIKLKSASITAACIHDELVDASETNSIILSEYLDSPEMHLDGVCLLTRNIKLARKCYSCGSFSCGIVNPPYHHDDENDDSLESPANDPSEPVENAAAVQCNVISSTVANTEWQTSSSCPLWDIIKSDHYTLEEKDSLSNQNFINLAVLRQHAHSNSHNAILDYQAFGLRSFPYNYHLSAHLNVLRHLFVSHTSRLVTHPLPFSITE